MMVDEIVSSLCAGETPPTLSAVVKTDACPFNCRRLSEYYLCRLIYVALVIMFTVA